MPPHHESGLTESSFDNTDQQKFRLRVATSEAIGCSVLLDRVEAALSDGKRRTGFPTRIQICAAPSHVAFDLRKVMRCLVTTSGAVSGSM